MNGFALIFFGVIGGVALAVVSENVCAKGKELKQWLRKKKWLKPKV